MAVFDHQEQEQLSELKAFWEQNGGLITTAVTILAVAAVGWQGFQWYRNQQAGEAATLYAAVEAGATQNSSSRTREMAGQLSEQHPKGAYAQLAALQSAHAQLQGGDLKSAEAQLRWMADNGENPAFKAMATLRLAALLLDAGEKDQALAALGRDMPAEFAFRRDDLKGDVLFAQGKTAEARKVWEQALAAFSSSDLGGSTSLRDLVQLKLDSIAGDQ